MKIKYLCFSTVLILTGCNNNLYEDRHMSNYGYENFHSESDYIENAIVESEEQPSNIFASLGIPYTTREVVLEDFFYLVNLVEENFPFLNALYRVYGIDFNERVDRFYRNFPPHQYITLQNAFTTLNSFLDGVGAGRSNVGHLQIISPDFLHFHGGQLVNNTGGGLPSGWLGAFLRNPNTIATYYALGVDIIDLFNLPTNLGIWGSKDSSNIFNLITQKNKFINQIPSSPTTISSTPSLSFDVPHANDLYYYLLEQTSTAFLRINEFNLNHLQANREIMRQFYRDISHLDNLIIDVSQNRGGYTRVWEELFAFPNIEHGYATTNSLLPMFFKDTPIVRNRLSARGLTFSYTEYFDSYRFPYIEINDIKDLGIVAYSPEQTFRNSGLNLFPRSEKRIAFEGNIYILIGPSSRSGADAFARFTRATGFATLVGLPSGGIGASWENTGGLAAHIPLPNTGLLMRMDLAYGINEVGRWNEEQGTLPDIWTMEGKSALGTALYHIARNRE